MRLSPFAVDKNLTVSLVHKSSTAVIVDGGEKINAETILEPGHRLNGCQIVPRMILGQQDAIDSLSYLIKAQQDLMHHLLPLYESTERDDWGAIFTCLACLSWMCARLFQDRRRHASENDHGVNPPFPSAPDGLLIPWTDLSLDVLHHAWVRP